MARVIIPTPSFSEVRVAELEPGKDWISTDALTWHRVLRLALDLPEATVTVGDSEAEATTVGCDPSGWILRLAPEARPRR